MAESPPAAGEAEGFTLTARSPEETFQLGMRMGECVEPGTVIALTGDLGSGKTVLVQGIAKGLGVPDAYYITSPTYTLIHDYPGRCEFHHVDLYRLGDAADAAEIGLYELLDGESVTAIEWADRLADADMDCLSVAFTIGEDESRTLRLRARGEKENRLLNTLRQGSEERK